LFGDENFGPGYDRAVRILHDALQRAGELLRARRNREPDKRQNQAQQAQTDDW